MMQVRRWGFGENPRIKLLHVFRGFANVMSHFAKEDDQNGVVDATGVWGNKLY